MLVRAFGKPFHLPVLKLFGLTILAAFLAGAGLFARQVYVYYRAIKSGEANPLLEQRLESSWSRLVANTDVTPEDVRRVNDPASPALGPTTTKLTVVEFLDYDCPYCLATFAPLREVMSRYQNRVRFVVRDFPLEDLHPTAMDASIAAGCARLQEKFWPYHDKLYGNPNERSAEDFLRFARETGLDETRFKTCVEAREPEERIRADQTDGLQAGVEGTPTFFFNGVKIQGALNKTTLEFLISKFLGS